MAPSEGKAINIGQGALAGAAVLGVGALAYYGAGLSGEMGAAEKAFIRAIVAVWSHKRRNSCFSCLVLTIDEAWQAHANNEPILWND